MFKRAALLVFLFGSLALGFYLWDQSENALQADISTEGVYHEGRQCTGNNCSANPFVAFKTRGGSSIKFYPFDVNLSRQQFLAAFYDESTYHEGQSVPVLYNPSKPAQAYISLPTSLWMDAIFWFALGGCILLGVMISSLRQGRSPGPSRSPGPPPGKGR